MTQSRLRLQPHEVFAHAFKIAVAPAQSSAVAISSNEDKNSSYAVKFSYIKNKAVILVCPAFDTDKITPDCLGATPLTEAVKLVRIEQSKYAACQPKPFFIIPLCEARPYSGFIPWAVSWLSWLTCGLISSMPHARQHWTLLTIQGDKCDFYDPKGTSSDWVYSLNSVEQTLKGFTLTKYYTGWQSWNDQAHCGYFVGELIKRRVDFF